MSQKTSIEWTDATWNPVRGCSRVSEGCRHCYAERQAARFVRPGQPFHGFAKITAPRDGLDRVGGRRNGWTGRVELVPEKLDEPLRWRKPRRIFVNSMSDLFHEKLSDESIAAVFGVMAACPQHTFQVLTKRPERARKWFELIEADGRAHPAFDGEPHIAYNCFNAALTARRFRLPGWSPKPWPLPNVWLGVSVEDQATADERIPLLLQTPAALRFVSYEPALGPVDFTDLIVRDGRLGEWHVDSLRCDVDVRDDEPFRGATLDWLIVGGESGPGARPFDVAWARSAVAQCRAAGVPVFVKQLGARPGYRPENGTPFPGPDCIALYDDGNGWRRYGLLDRKGGYMAEWPPDLRVREFPEARHGA